MQSSFRFLLQRRTYTEKTFFLSRKCENYNLLGTSCAQIMQWLNMSDFFNVYGIITIVQLLSIWIFVSPSETAQLDFVLKLRWITFVLPSIFGYLKCLCISRAVLLCMYTIIIFTIIPHSYLLHWCFTFLFISNHYHSAVKQTKLFALHNNINNDNNNFL